MHSELETLRAERDAAIHELEAERRKVERLREVLVQSFETFARYINIVDPIDGAKYAQELRDTAASLRETEADQ